MKVSSDRRKKQAEYQRKKCIKRKKMGLCLNCPEPICKESTRYCEKHATKCRERDLKHRIKQKKMGLCIRCSEPSINKNYCEKHAILVSEYGKKYNQIRRLKRKKMGLCIRCLESIWKDVSTIYCKKHTIKSREYLKKYIRNEFDIRRFIDETHRTWASKNSLSLKKN